MSAMIAAVGSACLVAAASLFGWYVADTRQRSWRAPFGITMLAVSVALMVYTGAAK